MKEASDRPRQSNNTDGYPVRFNFSTIAAAKIIRVISTHPHVRNAQSVLLWAFVVLSIYVVVGALAYPWWWRRFFFDGGIGEAIYWQFAFKYLKESIGLGQPLGLIVVTGAVLVVLAIAYRLGRSGSEVKRASIVPPRRILLNITLAALAVTGVGLVLTPGGYVTPDELHRSLKANRDDALKQLTKSIFSFEPPSTGLYVYLNPNKTEQAFSSLQKELTVALERTTKEVEETQSQSVDVKALDLSRVASVRLQQSIDKAPPSPTPSRQAQWLISQYYELSIAIKLFETEADESYEVGEARKTLSERGVQLSQMQEQTLKEGDAKKRFLEVSKEGAPIFFDGQLRVEATPQNLSLSFLTGGGAKIRCIGIIEEPYLEPNVLSCANAAEWVHVPWKAYGTYLEGDKRR